MKEKFLLLLVLFLVWSSTFFGFSGEAFAWTFDKSRMEFVGQLTNAEQNRFDIFQNEIQNDGANPRDAAQMAGDTNYRKLQGTQNQFEIRLSQATRATFFVDDANQVVTMSQIGGHT
ncbi:MULTISPECIES: hypothetical protein [unclassified Microcoleus]|uniref:hypothetical protein n=1 Tax=unclassified Microcoleus TaxID=2642155 RepID=UPI002FD58FE4